MLRNGLFQGSDDPLPLGMKLYKLRIPVTMTKWTLVSLVTSTSLRSQRGQIYLENHEIPSSCSNLKPAVTSASGVLDIEFVWAHRITLVISTGVCKLLRVLLALTRHRKEKTNHLSSCLKGLGLPPGKSRSPLTCISGQNGSWRARVGLKSIQCYTKGPSRPSDLRPRCSKPQKATCRPKGFCRECNSTFVPVLQCARNFSVLLLRQQISSWLEFLIWKMNQPLHPLDSVSLGYLWVWHCIFVGNCRKWAHHGPSTTGARTRRSPGLV